MQWMLCAAHPFPFAKSDAPSTLKAPVLGCLPSSHCSSSLIKLLSGSKTFSKMLLALAQTVELRLARVDAQDGRNGSVWAG